jgi:tRNA threonylcarbamoyladenosine biosynthesis protein TsaB
MNLPPEPCLVIDGSARRGIDVGVYKNQSWLSHASAEEGALEGLWQATEKALQEARLSLSDIRSFALCVGPGSMLGIRITALAVRTWSALETRPIYVWETLPVLAQVILQRGGCTKPFLALTESRMKRWHAIHVNPLSQPPIVWQKELSVEEVKAEKMPLYVTSESAQTVFVESELCAPVWPDLPSIIAQGNSLRLEPKPDALNAATDYATWSGERHRRNS